MPRGFQIIDLFDRMNTSFIRKQAPRFSNHRSVRSNERFFHSKTCFEVWKTSSEVSKRPRAPSVELERQTHARARRTHSVHRRSVAALEVAFRLPTRTRGSRQPTLEPARRFLASAATNNASTLRSPAGVPAPQPQPLGAAVPVEPVVPPAAA